jgi:hypothetical protein
MNGGNWRESSHPARIVHLESPEGERPMSVSRTNNHPHKVRISVQPTRVRRAHVRTCDSGATVALPVRRVSLAEGRDMLDRAARRYLGMSGDEFRDAYRTGRIDDPSRSDVMRVAMLLPFAKD